MLPFDFEYHLPQNAKEAYTLYARLLKENKNPVYFSGGTELISRGRVGNINFGAVIDIKGIQEVRCIKDAGKEIIIGAGVNLREITDSEIFPFLDAAIARIADHTIQNKITIGGNLMGGIIYKEAILPLLLCNAKLVIYKKNGLHIGNILDIYDKKLNLSSGDLLMEIRFDKSVIDLPFYHNKFVKSEKIDYPLLTLCAVRIGTEIKFAVSGLYSYPCIIDKYTDYRKKKDQILDDHLASAPYRISVLSRLISEAEKELNL